MLKHKPFVLNPDYAAVVEGSTPFAPPPSQRFQTSCLMLALIPFVLAGLTLVIVSARQWYVYWQLYARGIVTQAQVIERYTDSDAEETLYYLRVRFTAHDQQVYEPALQISSELYTHYAPEDSLEIRYDPNAPTTLRAAAQNRLPLLESFLSGFALLWNIFVWGVILGALNFHRKMTRLAASGETLSGELTSASGGKDDYDHFQVVFRYTFLSPAGQTLRGTAYAQRDDLLNALPAPGTPVVVLYVDDHIHMAL
ncbi:MAG: DUF3592 domain-containing protein [Anaerolineae bacterium]